MENKDSYNIVVDVDDTHLDFQDFAQTSALNNNILHDYPAPQTHQPNPVANNEPTSSIWSIMFWSKYFNVDTSQMVKRCTMSLQLDKEFIQDISAENFGPDLWGPFWISTTAIYSIFVSMIISSFISDRLEKPKGSKFSLLALSSAFLLIYSYSFLVPVALSFIIKYFGVSCSIIDVLAIYGYSNTIWVIVPILCIAPYSMIRWVAVAIGFTVSSIFIFRNIKMISERSNSKLNPVIIITIFLLSMALAVSMKFMFFSYAVVSK
ncbi:hypothetical protein BB561_002244 [Smittium simulii]|uniref:Protein YIP n=1 Tax=Smittium simulii TaxID=133385 RepID=A0A2T9YR90_9FUNG|nr:hypothetical protein BB561_002244 [Smittium simulii]